MYYIKSPENARMLFAFLYKANNTLIGLNLVLGNIYVKPPFPTMIYK